MNKYLILYAAVATALLCAAVCRCGSETERLRQNQEALASEITHYRTRAGAEAASAQVLRLRCAEFERLRAEDAARIRSLGIRLRRLESTAATATATAVAVRAPLRDTFLCTAEIPTAPCDSLHLPDRPIDPLLCVRAAPPALCTPARTFDWHDPWVRVAGCVRADSVVCTVRSVDTLHQVVHRIPRRFLFIRWGTKALRQEIVSTNPHTRIVHTEYVRIERPHRKQ